MYIHRTIKSMTLICRTITDGAGLEALVQQWQCLHDEAEGTVYQTPEWLTTWWRLYEKQFRLRVLTGWDGDRLVGLFPCFLQKVQLRICTVIRLRFMGEHVIVGEYTPLVHPEARIAFAREAAAFCANELAHGDCDVIDFHHFPVTSEFMTVLAGELRTQELAVRHTPQSFERVIMPAPKNADEYLKGLRGQERHTLRRCERALAEHGVRLEVVNAGEDPLAFEEFVQLHSRIWNMKGEGGHFKQWDGYEAFHRSMTASLGHRGAASLYFLTAENRRIAALQTYQMHGQFCAYLSGREPDHPLAHYSLGKVVISLAFRDAISKGYRELDMQQSVTDYKLRLTGGSTSWYSRLVIFPKGIRGSKGRLLLRAASLREGMGRMFLGRMLPYFERLSNVGRPDVRHRTTGVTSVNTDDRAAP
jgi:CelD/BcsL family acetyltransferase involved in cellulose biosynthesis